MYKLAVQSTGAGYGVGSWGLSRAALGTPLCPGTWHCPRDVTLSWGNGPAVGTSHCPGEMALPSVSPGSDTTAIAVPPATPPRTEQGWPRALRGTGQKPFAVASVELGGGWQQH